jgi:glycosyltransferase involved in cell wall biosynthesis
MHVCLIANQIAAWGKIGGFGTATRALGGALAARGVRVTAVVPRRSGSGQGPRERLDGIDVRGEHAWSTMASGRVFREIAADVYHSQEPTVASWWAQRAALEAVHVVTCRDPRGWRDHAIELAYGSWRRRLRFPVTWLYEVAPWVKAAVRGADAVLCPARFLGEKTFGLYGRRASFVPSPVDLPAREPRKSEQPLVLLVGRFDHRKRVERFFELARRFPGVRFAALGRAHEPAYDRRIREQAAPIGNLELPGEASRFAGGELASWYERSWVLVNTSAREALPYTFLEALAYGVAVLAPFDPDEVVSRFGAVVNADRFEEGLEGLLSGGTWRARGESGARWVRETFSEEASLTQHVDLYRRLLAARRAPATPRAEREGEERRP